MSGSGRGGGTGYISQQAIKAVISKVGKHRGVYGTVVCDSYGLPLQSDLDPDTAESIAAHVGSLVGVIKKVTGEIVTGTLPSSIRIETTNGNIEIIPDFNTEITIVAMVKEEVQPRVEPRTGGRLLKR
ncbi:MAG: roadblock/LC7 domain-containing protein [Candidatus Hodarchaeales archaeon]|jgi:predicted regulator of Ras-like GTPase activity (Roadblock/LC7/MglB family)